MRHTVMLSRCTQLLPHLWVLLSLVTGCGPSPTGGPVSHLNNGSQGTMTYTSWCDTWRLQCPSAVPANVPFASRPWTSDQWGAAFGSLQAVLSSGTVLTISAEDLQDPGLTRAAAAAEMTRGLESLRQQWESSGLRSLRFADGGVSFNFAGPAQGIRASGLSVATDASVQLRLGADRIERWNGTTLRGSDGREMAIKGVRVDDTNEATLVVSHGGADREIVGVPSAFLLEQLSNRPFGGSESGDFSAIKGLRALLAMKDWLVRGERQLDLTEPALRMLGQRLPLLAANEEASELWGTVLQNMTRISSTAASRRDQFLLVQSRRAMTCRVGTTVAVTLQPEVAIESITRMTDDRTRIVVRGVQAKPLSGLLRPTMTLQRIDVEPTRITILDVPLLGSITLRTDGSGSSEERDHTIVCQPASA